MAQGDSIVQMRLDGAEEVAAALAKMPAKMARKEMMKALKRSVKPILKSAKSKVPVRSGRLKRSLGTRNLRFTELPHGQVGVGISTDSKRAPHGHLVEFGTVKMAAQPFLRPALRENQDISLRNAAAEIRKMLEL